MRSVSIVTCTYNSSETLIDTLSSIKHILSDKKFIEFELIIVDSSEDNSVQKAIQDFDYKVRYYHVSAEGIYKAMNFGARVSKNDYVWFLNSDDYLADAGMPLKLLSLKMDLDLPIIFGRVCWIDAVSKKIKAMSSFNPLIKIHHLACYPPHPATMVRRDIFMSCNGFDEKLRISADFDLFLKIVKYCRIEVSETYFESKFLVIMRTGGASSKGPVSQVIKLYEDYLSIRKNGLSLILIILKRLTKGWFFYASKRLLKKSKL